MCKVVSQTLLYKQNTHGFPKQTIVFPKNPLFFQKTHCFPTCALFYPIVLKRKIITACISCTCTLYNGSNGLVILSGKCVAGVKSFDPDEAYLQRFF